MLQTIGNLKVLRFYSDYFYCILLGTSKSDLQDLVTYVFIKHILELIYYFPLLNS